TAKCFQCCLLFDIVYKGVIWKLVRVCVRTNEEISKPQPTGKISSRGKTCFFLSCQIAPNDASQCGGIEANELVVVQLKRKTRDVLILEHTCHRQNELGDHCFTRSDLLMPVDLVKEKCAPEHQFVECSGARQRDPLYEIARLACGYLRSNLLWKVLLWHLGKTDLANKPVNVRDKWNPRHLRVPSHVVELVDVKWARDQFLKQRQSVEDWPTEDCVLNDPAGIV